MPVKKPYTKPSVQTPKFSKVPLCKAHRAQLASGKEIFRTRLKPKAYLLEQKLRSKGIPVPDELIVRHLEGGFVEVYHKGHGVSMGDILEGVNRKKQAQIIASAVENLAKMHTLGVYHADLHEENIIVDPETNKVRFIDFEYSENLSKLKGVEDLNAKKLFDDLESILEIVDYYVAPQRVRTSKQKFEFLVSVFGTYLEHYNDSEFPGLKGRIKERIVEYLQTKFPTFMKYSK
ncbi:MAG: lipopolysaccharide kinase InaA family protein [Candidatus ainarchaeum sp.]|nr:lipopolysaccharide kinase InaA family protein [Candidatus ainarchaeum sp.]